LRAFAKRRCTATTEACRWTLALALTTANTAAVLKLERKGQLRVGLDAGVLVLHKDSLEIEVCEEWWQC
jgi:N-acetylglucosamine-6-phosphate deacetylase